MDSRGNTCVEDAGVPGQENYCTTTTDSSIHPNQNIFMTQPSKSTKNQRTAAVALSRRPLQQLSSNLQASNPQVALAKPAGVPYASSTVHSKPVTALAAPPTTGLKATSSSHPASNTRYSLWDQEQLWQNTQQSNAEPGAGEPSLSGSQSTATEGVAASKAARAEAALQHVHAQHPITQLIQQNAASVNHTGPAMISPHSDQLPASIPSPTASSRSQVAPSCSNTLTQVPVCAAAELTGPALISSSSSITNATRAETAAGVAAAVATLPDGRSSSTPKVLQVLDAVKAKLQVLEAMQQTRAPSTTSEDSTLPSCIDTNSAPSAAATYQAYTTHTAAPTAARQGSKSHHPHNRSGEMPRVTRFARAAAAPSARQHRASVSAGCSILDSVAIPNPAPSSSKQQTTSPARSAHENTARLSLDSSRAAAVAAASALAAGATKPIPRSAGASGLNNMCASSSKPDSFSQLTQSWRHWRSAAGAMLPQHTAPIAVDGPQPPAAQQLASQADVPAPRLQAAMMPQFLQQHVALARRAAAAFSNVSQHRQASAASSSMASCSGVMDTSGLVGTASCLPRMAAPAGTYGMSSIVPKLQSDASNSRVGNRRVFMQATSAVPSDPTAGTAAAAVALQQSAFAARVLQQLQPRPPTQQQILTAVPTGQAPVNPQTYLGLCTASTRATALDATVPLPDAPHDKPQEQQANQQPSQDDTAVEQSGDSFHSCLDDCAESQLSYRLASHMLRRTPYVGIGDRTYVARDFNYVEYAQRRLHAEPHAQDVFFVRDCRYESERLKQGARKRLLWTAAGSGQQE